MDTQPAKIDFLAWWTSIPGIPADWGKSSSRSRAGERNALRAVPSGRCRSCGRGEPAAANSNDLH